VVLLVADGVRNGRGQQQATLGEREKWRRREEQCVCLLALFTLLNCQTDLK